MTSSPPSDPKLTPLHRELAFWLALAMSLPGIAAVYVAAVDGVRSGSFDPGAFQSAFLALPVVAYLLARQYPRGKAAEAVGVQLAAEAHALGEGAFTPAPDEADDEGALVALPNVEQAEAIDAEGER